MNPNPSVRALESALVPTVRPVAEAALENERVCRYQPGFFGQWALFLAHTGRAAVTEGSSGSLLEEESRVLAGAPARFDPPQSASFDAGPSVRAGASVWTGDESCEKAPHGSEPLAFDQ